MFEVTRIRQGLQRRRRHLLVMAAVALIALVVTVEHSGAGGHEMADDGMGVAAGICLAVLGLAFLTVFALPATDPPRRAPRRAFAAPGALMLSNVLVSPPVRAGPAGLQVFLR